MKERAINREIGERTGCWKSGVLVEDDNGSVQKALDELKVAAACLPVSCPLYSFECSFALVHVCLQGECFLPEQLLPGNP